MRCWTEFFTAPIGSNSKGPRYGEKGRRLDEDESVLAVRRRDQEPPFAYPPLISHIFFTEALNEIGDSI
jgi:hypothetical protein